MRKNILASVLAAIIGTPVSADITPDQLTLSGFSFHGDRTGFYDTVGQRRPWQESNWGAALSWDVLPANSVTVAAFLNSYDTLGFAVTLDQVWLRGENWSAGIYTGLAYYEDYGSYQSTSYGHLGDEYEDFFLAGGFMLRTGDIQIRFAPGGDGYTSFASVSYVIDLNDQRSTASVGQALGWGF
jgi:hypothetical protein